MLLVPDATADSKRQSGLKLKCVLIKTSVLHPDATLPPWWQACPRPPVESFSEEPDTTLYFSIWFTSISVDPVSGLRHFSPNPAA